MNRRHFVMLAAVVAVLLALTIPFAVQPAAAHPSYGKPCNCHGTTAPGKTPTPTPKPAATPTPKPAATPTPPPAATPAPGQTPTATATAPADAQASPTAVPAAAGPAASHQEIAFDPAAPLGLTADVDPNKVYFAETGHYISAGFLAYWKSHGGLEVFGYPITEEFTEQNPAAPAGDGESHTVQYFQRARFEFHPELVGTGQEVQLGLLGAQVYSLKK
jgi:hypothetical protein